MHHGKTLTIALSLAFTTALAAAPAEAMTILPGSEAQAHAGGSSHEWRDGNYGNDDPGHARWSHDGQDSKGPDGRGGHERHDWNGQWGHDGDGDGDGYRHHSGGCDGDGYHHHGGGWNGGGSPQTVPLPDALPLLLSGLASLLTVARWRKE